MTSRSTARPASSEPAMARPSSSVSGVMTTSHSRRIPRATASTGSKLRDRSSQATIEPCACASAASRRTSVVRPLDPSPRIATLRPGHAAGPEDRVERGEPGVDDPVVSGRAGDGMVDRRRRRGRRRTACRGLGGLSRGSMAGASARAPSVEAVTRGAAAPQRAWRLATAAVTSGERVAIGCSR